MPLTAYDPDTGRIILPGSTAVSAQCRDPKCRAKLAQVRATDLRVAHFRHTVHSNCPGSDPIREREVMSPWHMYWQSQCTDPDRIEYTHVDASGDRRRADILTPYGWAIEVQHSAIGPKTIQARQNHWNGLVLWLLDAVSTDRSLDFSTGRRTILTGQWVHHLTTLIAVDDGTTVHLLPPILRRSHGEVWTDEVTWPMPREEFVGRFINAEQPPWTSAPRTRWRWDRAKRQDAQRQESNRVLRERQAFLRMQREALTGYECEYSGDSPERLMHDTPDVVVDLRDPDPDPPQALQTLLAPPQAKPTIEWPQKVAPDWRKTDASRHPVTRLPAAAHNARCADCARLVAHSEGRLKCDAFWTPSPATDINPTWAACSVWQPRKDI